MNVIWSEKVDDILSKGICLKPEIYNWALSKQEALQALEELEIIQVPVLGGDVYELKNGYIQGNYDNWYFNIIPEESHSHFVSRSIQKSKEYIERYKIGKRQIFFALVPKVYRE